MTIKSTRKGPTPVAHRVCPTDRIRAKIDELSAQDNLLQEILEELAGSARTLLTQAALEAEVTEFLGQCGSPIRGSGHREDGHEWRLLLARPVTSLPSVDMKNSRVWT